MSFAADLSEPSSRGSEVPPPVSGPEVVEPDASEAALRRIAGRIFERRSTALLAGERTRFMTQVDSVNPDFRSRPAMLFRNVQRLPFAELSYTVDVVEPPSATEAYGVPTFVSWVRVRHRLARFDTRPTRSSIGYTLVQRDGAWRIASDSDTVSAGQCLEPWDLAPLRVHVDRSLLVVTDAD